MWLTQCSAARSQSLLSEQNAGVKKKEWQVRGICLNQVLFQVAGQGLTAWIRCQCSVWNVWAPSAVWPWLGSSSSSHSLLFQDMGVTSWDWSESSIQAPSAAAAQITKRWCCSSRIPAPVNLLRGSIFQEIQGSNTQIASSACRRKKKLGLWAHFICRLFLCHHQSQWSGREGQTGVRITCSGVLSFFVCRGGSAAGL